MRIENCYPFSATAAETIVDSMCENNALKVIGLVNTPMTVETYKKLANCIKTSNYLTEVDLSDNHMHDPYVYVNMLRNISQNDRIRVLNFSHNKLMPETWFEEKKDPDNRQEFYPLEKSIYK